MDEKFDINDYYSIKEAAEMLKINQMTVRRRIKKGELQAIKHMGVYNQEQYFLPKRQFDNAEHFIEVVDVKKTYDLQQFALSLNAVLEDRETKIKEQIQSDISESKTEILNEIKNMVEHVEVLKAQNKAILEQNKLLTEQLKEEKSKSFLSKLLGK